MASQTASRARAGAWGRPLYRARQFFGGFRTALSPAEVTLARMALTRSELMLFAGMEPRDRRHSMNVLLWLRRSASLDGGTVLSRELETAALLHDLGKGRLHALERVAFVLLDALTPSLADRIGRAEGPRWRQGLWRLRHHARLGADALVAAGSSARVVELVAAHTERAPSSDVEQEWLRRADRAC